MNQRKLVGMTVRHAEYKDYDRMLTIVSPQHGKIDAIARGCRKQGSRLACAAEIFSYGEYVISEKNGRMSLSQFALMEAFYPIREDYTRLSAGAFVLKTLEGAAQFGQSCNDLFSLCYHTVSFLCYGSAPVRDLLLCYMLKYAALLGFTPATTVCAACGKSTFKDARLSTACGALCAACCGAEGEDAQPLTLEAMRRMMALPHEQMCKVVLPENVRAQLISFLPAYVHNHVGLTEAMRTNLHTLLKEM